MGNLDQLKEASVCISFMDSCVHVFKIILHVTTISRYKLPENNFQILDA